MKSFKQIISDIKFPIYSILIHLLIILVFSFFLKQLNTKVRKEDKKLVFQFVENQEPGEKPEESQHIAEEASRAAHEKILPQEKNIISPPNKAKSIPKKIGEKEIDNIPKSKDNLKQIKPEAEQQIPQKQNIAEVLESVKNRGGLKLNTYKWEFAPYLRYLKKIIGKNLDPPYAFTYMGIIHGDVLLRFRIYPEGKLENLKLLFSEAHSSLENCSKNAINFSEPFRPLPRSFPEEFLEITALFSYINQKEKK